MATTARKNAATKTAAGKAAKTPKYAPAAGESVGAALDEMKHGTLRSGRSGKKVTDPKQAVAIGLSEARAHGAKVPPAPKKRKQPSE